MERKRFFCGSVIGLESGKKSPLSDILDRLMRDLIVRKK